MSASDDRLDALLGAYREQAAAGPVDAAATRQRLLRSARTHRRRRRGGLAFAIAAALVLTNATTFAWFTGRLEPVVAVLSGDDASPRHAEASAQTRSAREASAPGELPAHAASPSRASRVGPAGARLEAPAEPASESPGRFAPPALAGSAPAAPAPQRGLPEPSAPQAAPASDRPAGEPRREDALAAAPDSELSAALETLAPPPADPERVAFERAHQAHFRTQEYAVALGRWRAYLRGYPEGRFVPEARYNVAICLLRLGQLESARDALRPFAAGRHGSARQAEAARLLRAMDEGRVRAVSP